MHLFCFFHFHSLGRCTLGELYFFLLTMLLFGPAKTEDMTTCGRSGPRDTELGPKPFLWTTSAEYLVWSARQHRWGPGRLLFCLESSNRRENLASLRCPHSESGHSIPSDKARGAPFRAKTVECSCSLGGQVICSDRDVGSSSVGRPIAESPISSCNTIFRTSFQNTCLTEPLVNILQLHSKDGVTSTFFFFDNK